MPGTPTAVQAALYARLAAAPDAQLGAILAQRRGTDVDLDAAASLEAPLLRQLIAAKVRDNNVISGAYKHVDGTSFAAPIVSSLCAQLLEANPRLSPQEVKRLVLATARRMPHVDVDRQGWGVVDARRAVEAAAATAQKAPGRPLGRPGTGG
jgi:serine protease AprX